MDGKAESSPGPAGVPGTSLVILCVIQSPLFFPPPHIFLSPCWDGWGTLHRVLYTLFLLPRMTLPSLVTCQMSAHCLMSCPPILTPSWGW